MLEPRETKKVVKAGQKRLIMKKDSSNFLDKEFQPTIYLPVAETLRNFQISDSEQRIIACQHWHNRNALTIDAGPPTVFFFLIMAVTMTLDTDPLLLSVIQFVQQYMSQNDASHNFEHIQRVVGLAKYIYTHTPDLLRTQLDFRTITLAALLHDVGDRKYLKDDEDPTTMVFHLLTNLGASTDLAQRVQTICLGVSYSHEMRDPARVRRLIALHPELAVVQDADRLDSMGAIGVGRCFTFGGARTESSSMEEAMEQVETRLLRVGEMMKTDVGRQLAKERSRRLMLFRDWYREEEDLVGMIGGRLY